MVGFTPSIVSRLINGDANLSIRDETRDRILKAIKKLDYRPNAVVRSLRLKTTGTIAIVLPNIVIPFFTNIIKGAQKAASEWEFSLIICNTEEDHVKEKEYIKLLAEKQNGILMASVYVEDEIIYMIHKYSLPYVLVNRTTKDTQGSYVVVNDVYGAILAIEHLISLGHKRIAHISGLSYTETGLLRLEVYRKALKKHNIEFVAEYVLESKFTEEDGYIAMKKLLSLKDLLTTVLPETT